MKVGDTFERNGVTYVVLQDLGNGNYSFGPVKEEPKEEPKEELQDIPVKRRKKKEV